MYQLKNGQEGFEVVDGSDAGKAYQRGKSYPKAPAGYENRFEKISTGKDTKKVTKSPGPTTKSSTMAQTPAKKEDTE